MKSSENQEAIMKKKNFILFLFVLLAMSLFANGNKEAPEGEEQVVLKYMTWYPPQNVMNGIITSFEKKYPNIKVEVEINEPGAHVQKLPIMLASGEDIDVMGVMVEIAKQVKPYLTNLDPVLSEQYGSDWGNQFNPGTLDWARNMTESKDVLIIPAGKLASPVVYYNAKLFRELGISPPKTMDELMEIITVIQTKRPDIIPVSFRGKLYWLHAISAFGIWGQENPELLKKVNNLEIPYNSPEVQKMAEWWASLFEKGIISKDTLDIDNNIINEIFYGGDAAMMIHGSWKSGLLSRAYREANDVALEEIGAFLFPSLSGNDPTTATIYDISLGINKNSKHPKEAGLLLSHILLEEGLTQLVDNFIIFPSKRDFIVNTEAFVDEAGQTGFQTLIEGISNPLNPERFFTPATKEFGRILQSGAIAGEYRDLLNKFQEDAVSGKF